MNKIKLKFIGTCPFWFPDLVKFANENLKSGEIYTLKSRKIFSSWTKILLEETGEQEYNLAWFEEIK